MGNIRRPNVNGYHKPSSCSVSRAHSRPYRCIFLGFPIEDNLAYSEVLIVALQF